MKLRLPLFMRRDGMRLGWPGAIGLGALALCLAFHVAILLPAQQRVDAARRTVASMQQRLGAASKPETVLSLDEQLAAFYANFPREQDAAESVGRIAAIAGRHGLVLQQADYKVERDKGGKLTRFQMNLPLKGAYPTIRQFLASLRSEMRVVALEQVQFERQKVGDAAVDAKLRLVIYLGASS